MRVATMLHRSFAATLATALLATPPAIAAPAGRGQSSRVAQLPAGTQRPTTEVLLSTGQGELITLPTSVVDVWTSNPGVADVYVSNPRQIHLFGKDAGEATVFATAASGAVVYAANVRVNQNITSLDRVLRTAMPDAQIRVTNVGQVAVLTGTVASPDDIAQAQQIVLSLLNPGVVVSDPAAVLKMAVINRLKTATPMQVNLQVRFAEVSRTFGKQIGVNLAAFDGTGGFKFGIGQGRAASPQFSPGGGLFTGMAQGSTGTTVITNATGVTTLGLAGRLLGLDLLGAIDLGESIGHVTTLANPNLTALSGETGTFLAGGEIPIPLAQGLGAISVDYKQYGVSLSYTPTVLSDGRISLRVRPEVSQLDYSNAITLSGTRVPGISTRRAETTVELGSGQSFMIGGLLQNSVNNGIQKAPFLGDIPILGALFRSNTFQRNESELVIIITPYLVRPVNANQMVLPSDGYQAPTDAERVLLGIAASGQTGGDRPKPTMVAPAAAAPTIGVVAPIAPGPFRKAEDAVRSTDARDRKKGKAAVPAPGFSIN